MTTASAPPLLNTLSVGTAGPRVAFLHGLFGQGRNWSQIAKAVAGPDRTKARCLLVDLPDHGRSPWSEEFTFEGYAEAVAATLARAAPGDEWVVVGHSLGGKTAMLLALLHPHLLRGLVVVDISPKSYGSLHRFGGYIKEMRGLPLDELATRAEAEQRFTESDPDVKAFLLQNLRRNGRSWRWQANLDLIEAEAARGAASRIAGWPSVADDLAPYEGPTLWIAGKDSDYIERADASAMRSYFPRARLFTIKGAGHWVHTDAPDVTVAALRRFLTGVDAPSPTPSARAGS
ncbi:MAG: alpha/beta fold hydrolase [Micrococcales bacterium]|nr:alpha/beta fold hydrolase [Micrococcales bacterium]